MHKFKMVTLEAELPGWRIVGCLVIVFAAITYLLGKVRFCDMRLHYL